MQNSIQKNRLETGGRIDRGKTLNFSFDGKALQGHPGDTLASALLANGVNVVARSFKYGRPRGVVGHGAEEPNAIVQVGTGATTIPNLRATQVELYEGLQASSVGGWPSVEYDVMGLLGKFGRLMPPGFYYKTFMQPKRLWMTYEHFIRKAAGLGKSPEQADPDVYDKFNQHCDVLIVGAGPAGLATALGAGRAGARVILADEQSEVGGSLLASSAVIGETTAAQWVAEVAQQLSAMDNVQVLKRSTVFGYYDHNFLTIAERRNDHLGRSAGTRSRERLHRIRAKQVVLATGAIERPIVFANNDIPGVMVASSVSTYVKRYGVTPGERMILFTSNDNAYQSAMDWHSAGRQVCAVIDSRQTSDGEMVKAVRTLGIEVITGHALIEAHGSKRVNGASIAPVNSTASKIVGAARRIECDLIACSGGWSPVVHLSSQTGVKPVWNEEIIGFVPGESGHQHRSVGAAKGHWTLLECLTDGAQAGAELAALAGLRPDDTKLECYKVEELPQQPAHALFLAPHSKSTSRAPSQFVDLQLDVTAGAIELAAREGYDSIEHAKRYTAMGFGTDQGKLGNINGMAILAKATGQTIAETGTTIFRPAYTPTTFGTIAGRDVGKLFDPERYTPMHRWHEVNGAVWEDVGQWKRPWYFPKTGESMHEAVSRECLAVRNSVGILDASTLGKIDIQGIDAAEFITRIYTNSFLKLAPGKCRYGLMLKEDGMVFDDGVTACLGDNHYQMFTTTGGAAGVLEWLE
ncbi:MAG: sarcosine oxidase subunit alpha, partial [Halioglobus sp.]